MLLKFSKNLLVVVSNPMASFVNSTFHYVTTLTINDNIRWYFSTILSNDAVFSNSCRSFGNQIDVVIIERFEVVLVKDSSLGANLEIWYESIVILSRGKILNTGCTLLINMSETKRNSLAF